MTTTAVSRLSAALADRYRIERELGAGGMATVYLAEDLKHDRKVALKVLKPELAAVLGAERFVVEIKTTAALQHPHILPLFDSGTADGFLFYVMPFIEGETLRDQLSRETQLSIDEAVRITSDVADALDYAHRHGVIHRDIKPENILLHDGRPMVADFGIALAVSAAAGGRMTETGLSLGTPHYMSPEQATAAKDITGRSDIYSLGSVLYEMLTGNPPHVGATAQQIIMKIVTEEAVPVTRVRKSVPPNIAAAIARSLEKLPADRFATAAEFRQALRDPHFSVAVSAGTASASTSRSQSRLLGALVGVSAVAIVAAVWGWTRGTPPEPVLRYTLAVPPSPALGGSTLTPVPLPDGSALIYNGPVEGGPGSQLWIKRRDAHTASPIPGTLGASAFAISPDGNTIAFGSGAQLRRIPVSGGAAETIVPEGVGAQLGVTWLDQNRLAFVAVRDRPVLATVAATGGDVAVVWQDSARASVLPEALPDGNGVLFAACTASAIDACDLWAHGLSGDSGHRVLPGVAYAQYAPTGHLIYMLGGRLLAIEFDPRSKTTRGSPITLGDGLATDITAAVRLSRSGTLVIELAGSTALGSFQLVWVDRAGRETPVDTAWRFRVTGNAANHGWALSPDGRRLAIGIATDAGDDIYVKQLPRGPAARLSLSPADEFRPRWTPDSRSVTFVSTRSPPGIYVRRADGTGEDSLVAAGAFNEALYSPDGRWLVFREGGVGAASGGRDITAMRLGQDTARQPLLVTPADEEAIAISPDSRWMAYQSDETGRTEVFIRSFPEMNRFKRQVSAGGGIAPLWSRDGRELFYVADDKQLMAVRIGSGSPPELSDPVALFRMPAELLQVEAFFYTPWDIAPDGRFIMARVEGGAAARGPTVVVAENWLSELREKTRR